MEKHLFLYYMICWGLIFSVSHTKKKSCLSKESYLYFIPVLIYTPNKVKSEQRGEKEWLRKVDQPIYRGPPMKLPIFSFGCKNIRDCILFLVDINW